MFSEELLTNQNILLLWKPRSKSPAASLPLFSGVVWVLTTSFYGNSLSRLKSLSCKPFRFQFVISLKLTHL